MNKKTPDKIREIDKIVDRVLLKKKNYMGIYVKGEDKINDRIVNVVTKIAFEIKEETLKTLTERIEKSFDNLITFLHTERQYDDGKIKINSAISHIELTKGDILNGIKEMQNG